MMIGICKRKFKIRNLQKEILNANLLTRICKLSIIIYRVRTLATNI